MKPSTRFLCTVFALQTVLAMAQSAELVLPQALYYNATHTRMELFVAQHQRQYTANTKIMDQQLASFKADYNSRLDVIGYQSDLLEAKLDELDNKLVPQELLDEVNNYCVQRYRGKLPTFTTIKTNLANCMQKGTSFAPSLVAPADTTLRNLKNYYTNQFTTALNACKTKHKATDKALTTCIIAAVDATTAVTITNINTFNTQLKSSLCTAGLKVKEVTDCYAAVIASSYSALGEVTALVDNCVAGHEFCPSCGDAEAIGRCPYQLGWHMSPDDLIVDKINNPFKGLRSTTPCLQINFITNSTTVPLQ